MGDHKAAYDRQNSDVVYCARASVWKVDSTYSLRYICDTCDLIFCFLDIVWSFVSCDIKGGRQSSLSVRRVASNHNIAFRRNACFWSSGANGMNPLGGQL